MNRTNTLYWIFNGLLALMLGFGAVFDAISHPKAIEHITQLGYPAYIVPFLGVAKILGVIAILIPKYPRLKEWAYAGLAYDIIGALYSHIAHGDGPDLWGGLVVGILMLALAYFFHVKRQREVGVRLA